MDSILFSSVAQVLVFGLVSFLVHLIGTRTYKRFFRSVGLYKTPSLALKLGAAAGVLLAAGHLLMVRYVPGAKAAYLASDANAGMIRDFDDIVEKITAILLIASLKTAFSEELLFRGAIGRILIRRIGFPYGNLLQSLIFGILAVFLLLDMDGISLPNLLFPFLLSTAAGYCAGYLNAGWGNGSIWPGFAMHLVGDIGLFGVLAFAIH